MDPYRLSAFSDGPRGGNPAGVVIADTLPDDAAMQATAARLGFSETAFAAPVPGGWRVRYFAPVGEVPFCGHATLALGAALAMREGAGRFSLQLNHARIAVDAAPDGELFRARLDSPPTRSEAADPALRAAALALFGLGEADLDPRLPPARIHAGADHLLLALNSRATLARLAYDFEAGRALMLAHGLVTIAVVFSSGLRRFDVRNAFASGGVPEDPATGAAAAAFAGYLRDLGWPHGGQVELAQGDDMGRPSRLTVTLDDVPGAPVRVAGTVRRMADDET